MVKTIKNGQNYCYGNWCRVQLLWQSRSWCCLSDGDKIFSVKYSCDKSLWIKKWVKFCRVGEMLYFCRVKSALLPVRHESLPRNIRKSGANPAQFPLL